MTAAPTCPSPLSLQPLLALLRPGVAVATFCDGLVASRKVSFVDQRGVDRAGRPASESTPLLDSDSLVCVLSGPGRASELCLTAADLRTARRVDERVWALDDARGPYELSF